MTLMMLLVFAVLLALALPVGYALLTAPELDAARDGDIELKKIYLLSRFHGGGVARELFAAMMPVAAVTAAPTPTSRQARRRSGRIL